MRARASGGKALLQLNWVMFAACFAWTSSVQGRTDWWLALNWGSWLADWSALARLEPLPAGSLWILWLLLGVLATLVRALKRERQPTPEAEPTAPAAEQETPARKQLHDNFEMLETHPELKEKILRLHQSLDQV